MNIIYEQSTSKSLEDAVKSLKSAIESVNFSVLWEINFKDKLREKGIHFAKNFVVLEVCNATRAKDVLENNLLVGYFLPCKVVVYESENNNEIKIGILKPTALMSLLEDPHLLDLARYVEHDLIKAVQIAAKEEIYA